MHAMPAEKNLLMVTISGRDRPGISAAFAKVLMAHNVELVDIEQASPQDILGLYMLLDLGSAGGSKDSVIKDLLFEASRLDLTLNFKLYGADELRPAKGGFYVLSHFGGTSALAAIAGVLGDCGVNIETISTLDHHGPLAMEMTLKMGHTPAEQVKKRLLAVSRGEGFDLAMQTVAAYRKNKRMVFFDMDSTLISQEVIDELARLHGVHRQVARITEKAMRGDFDFEESLMQRVALLKGLTVEKMAELRDGLKLNQGVEEVVATPEMDGLPAGRGLGRIPLFRGSPEGAAGPGLRLCQPASGQRRQADRKAGRRNHRRGGKGPPFEPDGLRAGHFAGPGGGGGRRGQRRSDAGPGRARHRLQRQEKTGRRGQRSPGPPGHDQHPAPVGHHRRRHHGGAETGRLLTGRGRPRKRPGKYREELSFF